MLGLKWRGHALSPRALWLAQINRLQGPFPAPVLRRENMLNLGGRVDERKEAGKDDTGRAAFPREGKDFVSMFS